MQAPLQAAAKRLHRRRNAICPTAAFAEEVREGMQMLAGGGSSNTASTSSTAAPPTSGSARGSPSPSPPPLASPPLHASALPTPSHTLRLTQRRNALAPINSRVLRLALNLPVTPSPLPSPCRTPLRRGSFSGPSANGAAGPLHTPSSSPRTSFVELVEFPSHPSADAPPARPSSPFGLQSSPLSSVLPSSVSPGMRRSASMEEGWNRMMQRSPFPLVLSPTGAWNNASPLSVASSGPSAPPSTSASPFLSPLHHHFLGSRPPSSTDSHPSPSHPLPPRPPVLLRRRTAVIAHSDFRERIPPEWNRRVVEEEEKEAAEDEIMDRTRASSIPITSIRLRTPSPSPTAVTGGSGPVWMRRRSFAFPAEAPSPRAGLLRAFSDQATTPPLADATLQAAHTPLFSPSLPFTFPSPSTGASSFSASSPLLFSSPSAGGR